MKELPFHVSPQAKAWLSRLPEKAGEELGFVCFPRYGMSRGSEVLEAFDHEHYAFVHASPATWSDDRSAIRVAVDAKAFWLTPEIVHRLEGKKLEVIRVDVGQGPHSGRFREFLVASAHEEKTPNQSPQPTRLLGPRFSAARFRSTARCHSKKAAFALPRAAEL